MEHVTSILTSKQPYRLLFRTRELMEQVSLTHTTTIKMSARQNGEIAGQMIEERVNDVSSSYHE